MNDDVKGNDMKDEVQDRLYATTDAAVWAAEFCAIAKKLGHDIDESWMIGWFANAIENAKDHERRQSLKSLKDIVNTQCTDDALQAAEDRGWNAALEACHAIATDGQGLNGTRIRALQRGRQA